MVPDPAGIEEQRRVEDAALAAGVAIEVSVLALICRRLGAIRGSEMREVYASMPQDLADIREILNSGVKSIDALVEKSLEGVARGNDEWARPFYEAAGKAQTSALNHDAMSRVLREQAAKASGEAAAQCRSAVVAIDGGDKLVPVEKAYKETVERAAVAMASGAMPGDIAIGEAVRSLSESGLKVVYESGVTRSLYTAVSTNVMDAYRTALGLMREIQGLEFGADGVEVSAHAESAPDHLPYQGRQYSRAAFKRIQDTDLASRPLETGANCGHVVSPILMGASSPKYTERELAELSRLSTKKVTVTGLSGNSLSMSRYEATQYQRRIETEIRKAREQAYLARQAGLDSKATEDAAKELLAKYRRISGEAGLTTRMERTRAYVLE